MPGLSHCLMHPRKKLWPVIPDLLIRNDSNKPYKLFIEP